MAHIPIGPTGPLTEEMIILLVFATYAVFAILAAAFAFVAFREAGETFIDGDAYEIVSGVVCGAIGLVFAFVAVECAWCAVIQIAPGTS